MPINCPLPIGPVTNEAFEYTDAAVMRCAYASQNELGRLCDEHVYENDLAARLRAEGLTDVHTQVPVTVTHRGFSRVYRLDVVVNQVVYELKTAAAIVPEHAAQAIHYAVMLGTDRVKLINFRSHKVTGMLQRSPLVQVDRRQTTFDGRRWRPLSAQCERLLADMQAFLNDTGAFLEAALYHDALVHRCGGEARCLRRLSLARDELQLGTHRFTMHAEGVAFVVTCFKDAARAYESQLQRLLRLTDLRGLQWLNLARTELHAITLTGGRSEIRNP